jgi:hypothetical protein
LTTTTTTPVVGVFLARFYGRKVVSSVLAEKREREREREDALFFVCVCARRTSDLVVCA